MKRRKQGERAHASPQLILDSACRLMAAQGFFGVSFQSIADDLGLSQSTIMHYFPNKLALVRATIESIVLKNHAAVSALIGIDDSGLERLRKHFIGNLQWAQSEPTEASTILLLYYMGSVNEDFGKLYSFILEKAQIRIKEYLLAAVREGEISPEVDLQTASEILHETLLASLLNVLASHQRRFKLPEIKNKWESLFESLLKPRKGFQKKLKMKTHFRPRSNRR
jgi:AcrR family transcriptional regulator